jgi:hypothetical protein
MRRTVLIAALVLVSASAQAGQSRHLSVAGSDSRPISMPLPPAPASRIAEVPPTPAATQAAPAAVAPAQIVAAPAPVAPPAAVSAAPETGAPPVVAAPVPPPLPPAATTAAPAAVPAVDAPKYVERPTVAPATTDAPKVDDGKPSKRAERRHRGEGWTASRVMGELRRYGISYGYGGW